MPNLAKPHPHALAVGLETAPYTTSSSARIRCKQFRLAI